MAALKKVPLLGEAFRKLTAFPGNGNQGAERGRGRKSSLLLTEVLFMRAFKRIAAVLAMLVLVPALAFAQASITGTVRDASGAVLPGVTVEAASPALIEKVRSTVTDGEGLYRIVDLRPGTYTVTAMLPGFSTARRDGIVLTGTVTLTVPLEMKVGALEETIT